MPDLRKTRLPARLAVIACLSLSILPAPAAGPAPPLTGTSVPVSPGRAPVRFADIAAASPEIVLACEDAKVAVKLSPSADGIAVSSNCPSHWNVTGNVIRQVAVSTTRKGVALRADAAGATISLNGKIYQLPRDSDGAIRSLKVEGGAVTVNGKKLEPIPGSDKPGDCTGPDVLEVTVPEGFRGGLVMSLRGASDVTVPSWQGATLTAVLSGPASFTSGKIKTASKVVIDVQGEGKAEIASVDTKSFVANINGSGLVDVRGGAAEMSNATVSGSGKMVLKGKYRNLKKSVNGDGKIEVIE